MVHHASLVKKRNESFFGREKLMRAVMANIADKTGKITVIHGLSGTGNSLIQTCGARILSRENLFDVCSSVQGKDLFA